MSATYGLVPIAVRSASLSSTSSVCPQPGKGDIKSQMIQEIECFLSPSLLKDGDSVQFEGI